MVDEKSDSSSVRSGGSICGSSPITPCDSPTLSGSSSEKEPSSSAPHSRSLVPVSSQGKLYFVIKGSSQKAIEASLNKGLWIFSTSTERKVVKCLQVSRFLIVESVAMTFKSLFRGFNPYCVYY